mmetsp:Transcript_25047/g.64672  ORF Transcript_25047/g.64672 Transcript_25047/m.64672 type:complete len:297 (-) Transcript_25047:90-980(-)
MGIHGTHDGLEHACSTGSTCSLIGTMPCTQIYQEPAPLLLEAGMLHVRLHGLRNRLERPRTRHAHSSGSVARSVVVVANVEDRSASLLLHLDVASVRGHSTHGCLEGPGACRAIREVAGTRRLAREGEAQVDKHPASVLLNRRTRTMQLHGPHDRLERTRLGRALRNGETDGVDASANHHESQTCALVHDRVFGVLVHGRDERFEGTGSGRAIRAGEACGIEPQTNVDEHGACLPLEPRMLSVQAHGLHCALEGAGIGCILGNFAVLVVGAATCGVKRTAGVLLGTRILGVRFQGP